MGVREELKDKDASGSIEQAFVKEAKEGDAQANPAEPVKESGAGQNAQAAAPIKEAPTKEEATVAKVADSVAEQELSKKVAAIEGEVNKALDDQQSQQVAVV